jgi:hypothetical protein
MCVHPLMSVTLESTLNWKQPTAALLLALDQASGFTGESGTSATQLAGRYSIDCLVRQRQQREYISWRCQCSNTYLAASS